MDQKRRNILDEYLTTTITTTITTTTTTKNSIHPYLFLEEWSQFRATRLNHFFISILGTEYAKPYETRKNTHHKMF